MVILGAGESGTGAACLAQSNGYDVFVSEKGSIAEQYRATLMARGIPYEEGQHDLKLLLEADTVVKSPGIPDRVPVVQQLHKAGIPVISEIEFAFPFVRGPVIAVTGSNGKTTTTRLIHQLLRQGRTDVHLAGNMGKSLAASIDEGKTEGIYVLELSSFQLDGIRDFRPDISAILNITPDHLDRYDYQLGKYIDSKFRIIRNQTGEDHFYYSAGDPNIAGALEVRKPVRPQMHPVRLPEVLREPFRVEGQTYALRNLSLRGNHNRMNAAFALAIAGHFVSDRGLLQRGLDEFQNAEHRMEVVGTLRGIEFVNDSKATNVDAVYYALEAMEKPVIWIVGGQDKGNDYRSLDVLVEEKVKAIICLGKDNAKIREHFGGFGKPLYEAREVAKVVQLALQEGQEGDVALLSPACASFDLFRNFEDRGNKFKSYVLSLIEQNH